MSPRKPTTGAKGTQELWKEGDGPGKPGEEDKWKLYDVDTRLDMNATSKETIRKTFPPANVLLSDFWVGWVCQSDLSATERDQLWPADFTDKGYIRASRKPRGKAYKVKIGNEWYYGIAGGNVQLHGSEGAALLVKQNGTPSAAKTMRIGNLALISGDHTSDPKTTINCPSTPERNENKKEQQKSSERKDNTKNRVENVTLISESESNSFKPVAEGKRKRSAMTLEDEMPLVPTESSLLRAFTPKDFARSKLPNKTTLYNFSRIDHSLILETTRGRYSTRLEKLVMDCSKNK